MKDGNPQPLVLRQAQGPVARLALTTPGHFNALSRAMIDAPVAALDEIADDHTLRAVLLAALPEVLRYGAGPLQAMTDGRLDSAILRQLLIALAMIIIMLMRPRGLWPSPEHGKSLTQKT